MKCEDKPSITDAKYLIIINESRWSSFIADMLLILTQVALGVFAFHYNNVFWSFLTIVMFLILFTAKVNGTKATRFKDVDSAIQGLKDIRDKK